MSGTMHGAAPQLPPQVLQAIMARLQGQQPGMAQVPPGMPGSPPPAGMPGAMPPPGMPGVPPPVPPQGMPPAMPTPQQMPPGTPQAPQLPPQVAGGRPMGQSAPQMAMQGRFGDSIVAHVSPGEIQIPPEAQTPQLMAAIRAAFARFGIGPQTFTAGSPQASRNPATGAQEFSILGALLPIAGAIGGSFIPGIGTAAGAALGGAAGGAAGGLIDHSSPLGTALGAAGGAAGGYFGAGGTGGLSGLIGGSGGAAGDVAGAAGTGTFMAPTGADAQAAIAARAAAGDSPAMIGAGTIPQASPYSASPSVTSPSMASLLKIGSGAGIGAGLGQAVTPPPASSGLPAGFNNPLPPLNPNFNQLLGNSNASTPSFTGYNPYSVATGGGYNFYG